MAVTKRPLFDPPIVKRAARDAFVKLAPAHMVRNPVMFVVLVGSVFTTVALVREVVRGAPDLGFLAQLALWLWFTVLFANFAEAMAEGRGRRRPTSCARPGGSRRPSGSGTHATPRASRRCPPATFGWATWCCSCRAT